MKLPRPLAAVGIAVAVGAGAVGCGAAPQSVTYVDQTPTMADYGRDGRCFYVDDPYEVAQLQAAGLCPVGWRAVRYSDDSAALAFFLAHEWAYRRPDYVARYVVREHRTVVVKEIQRVETVNHGRIATTAPKKKVTTTSGLQGNGRKPTDAQSGYDKVKTAAKSAARTGASVPKVRSSGLSGSGRKK
jgi:hypothetical protein